MPPEPWMKTSAGTFASPGGRKRWPTTETGGRGVAASRSWGSEAGVVLANEYSPEGGAAEKSLTAGCADAPAASAARAQPTVAARATRLHIAGTDDVEAMSITSREPVGAGAAAAPAT